MNTTDRIGARLTPSGTFFRVWAPNAADASVLVQRGPRWSARRATSTHRLSSERNGYWSQEVVGVTEGDLYRFLLRRGGHELLRLDPAARDTVHSGLPRVSRSSDNASIVVAADAFEWAPFRTPNFENFLIYQFHVGSFAGRNDHFGNFPATFRQAASKFDYIRELGFNAIEPLPVQEFAMERSWGYNPAAFFAPESAYGSPDDLREMVNLAHRHGLAVIFDVVYNHAGPGDNVLWEFDGPSRDGGIYFDWGQDTPWGRGPSWGKREVQEFFYQNARMYFEDYDADGLRFDVTTQINGHHLGNVIRRLKQDFPSKYLIAEHLPDHPWIVNEGGFHATWQARSHHECQRALMFADRPIDRIKSFLGADGYAHAWNLVRYTGGSHDDVGDDRNGNAKDGLTNHEARHRYLIDQLGGVANWHARAKCRLAWALNVTMPGTPMLFMGTECLLASPAVSWGYWHDGWDDHGDHRFNWAAAGDVHAMEMRRLVVAANHVRWQNPALRSDSYWITHEDHDNQVLGFMRELYDNTVLVVVNLSDRNFGAGDGSSYSYGVSTSGRAGRWTQTLCTQDAAFGGWHGAGNAYHEPRTQPDGRVYINLPKWSVVVLRRE